MKITAAAVATSVCLLGLAGQARASSSVTAMDVNATVTATCTGLSAPLMLFPSVAQNSAATVSSTLTATCGNGVAYTIDVDNGAYSSNGTRRMITPEGNYLPYTLSVGASCEGGSGTPVGLGATNIFGNATTSGTSSGNLSQKICGTVSAADTNAAVPSPHYGDTVIFTLNY